MPDMKVRELGEFGLIERLNGMIPRGRGRPTAARERLIIGIGDDAAAWYGDTSIQLATVDSLIQDVHFSLNTASWEEVGWKSLAVNVSDIAAMGGLPGYALISLGLPGDTGVEDVIALYRGMIDLAGEYEVDIIGGNTVSAPQVVINVTVLGSTGSKDGQILTRSAARPGDLIAVTGTLGAAAAGVEILGKGLTCEPGATASLRKACLHPRPRVAEGRLLVEQGVKTAIDISDGLIADLNHICQESRVGARVEVDRVPISPAVKECFPDRALELALSGGEDYELLFTAAADNIDRVRMAASCPITVIGEIASEGVNETVLVDSHGNPVSLPGTGWDHYNAARNQK
ncbi:MAG TPA: thiamine-phosphate kinase [Dehalococcoidales bacterium]|nr:thiamine-phosphate kinase [Dehalococcoidales bacterium]